MKTADQQSILMQFQKIPGVGKKVSQDLWDLGFRSLQDLKEQNPEEMYIRLCALQGQPVDRCMLYVFRCAVYYVTEEIHQPELLKWWNWKDEQGIEKRK